MTTAAPVPPCDCETCSGLRSAIEKLELPTVLSHDDGSLVLVDAGGTEISAAEAWLRRLIASPDPQHRPRLLLPQGRSYLC